MIVLRLSYDVLHVMIIVLCVCSGHTHPYRDVAMVMLAMYMDMVTAAVLQYY